MILSGIETEYQCVIFAGQEISVVPGTTIRGFYAVTVTAGFLNRVCALPEKLMKMGYVEFSKGFLNVVSMIGNIGFFIIITAFATWVFWCFFTNLKTLTAKEAH